MIPETSAQGTLMLRECVENADTSEFKCENKLGDQGTVSFFPCIIFMLSVFRLRFCELSEETHKAWTWFVCFPRHTNNVCLRTHRQLGDQFGITLELSMLTPLSSSVRPNSQSKTKLCSNVHVSCVSSDDSRLWVFGRSLQCQLHDSGGQFRFFLKSESNWSATNNA